MQPSYRKNRRFSDEARLSIMHTRIASQIFFCRICRVVFVSHLRMIGLSLISIVASFATASVIDRSDVFEMPIVMPAGLPVIVSIQ